MENDAVCGLRAHLESCIEVRTLHCRRTRVFVLQNAAVPEQDCRWQSRSPTLWGLMIDVLFDIEERAPLREKKRALVKVEASAAHPCLDEIGGTSSGGCDG